MLSPRRLVERERHAGVVQSLADEVAALWWDVGVFLAEDLGKELVSIRRTAKFSQSRDLIDETKTDHNQLATNVLDAFDTVVVLALAERLRVDVGGEIAHGGSDAFVESAAESEMAAETHSCGADAAVASLHVREEVDAQRGVFVVG